MHYSNNHAGRDTTVQYLYREGWYWYGIYGDVNNTISVCPVCQNPSKFKKIQPKKKLLLKLALITDI